MGHKKLGKVKNMVFLYTGGIILILTGIAYLSPIKLFLIKNNSLAKIAGIVLIITGIYLIFRGLTL